MNIDVPMSKKWFSRYVNATVITGTIHQGTTERTSSRPFLFTINDGLNEQETLQSNVPFLFMATKYRNGNNTPSSREGSVALS